MVRRLQGPEKMKTKLILVNRNKGLTCKHCKIKFKLNELTIDHIKPIWMNGTNHLTNLQLLCFECHKQKSKKEYPYNILDFMYHRWCSVISTYRHRSFLYKLVRLPKQW